MINRKQNLFGVGLYLIALCCWADNPLEIIVDGGISAGRPIAVIEFDMPKDIPENVSAVVKKDLIHSGRFKPIKTNQIPLALRKNPVIDLNYWRSLSVEAVLTGRIWQKAGQNDYFIEYTLWDVLTQAASRKQTKHARISGRWLRSYAHRISDYVFAELTGILGAFSTRIAYINVNHKRQYPFYLKVSDYDGHNAHTVLRSKQPLMSPTWSPDGTQLAYVSFENKQSEIYIQNIYTRKRERLTSFPRINGAPRWSPDGNKMAMVLSKDGQPNIYIMTLKDKTLQRLTYSHAIDTEPTWAPDGKSIIYTSDRGGSPQIYQTHIDSGKTTRLTWKGDHNLAAAITPLREQLIVVSRVKQGYRIARHDLDVGFMQVLTQSSLDESPTTAPNDFSLDESPTIAPNGSMIIYSKFDYHQHRQVLALVSVDGNIKAKLLAQDGDTRSPAWSQYANNREVK